MFDLNVAPAITSTGRSLISSAILCFEGFLGNNVQFSSLNDILIFIDNIRMEHNEWEYDDYEVLGPEGFVDVDEAFTRIFMSCGFKYIPTYEDMDVVYKILQNCNQTELNRIFYKNNLYCFMDLDKPRELMVNMIINLKTPFVNPNKPPKEILNYLDELKSLLIEYVFYNHQWMDRMNRNKEMIKTVSIVSDTDSSFVSLDAWYHYNMQYLKNYDCPIMHQSLDLVQLLDKEKKDDDYYWKDPEDPKKDNTPEWYNAIDKRPGVKILEIDSFGDIKDPHALDGVIFDDEKLDYDFFNDEIIEQKRMINPLIMIPQDNVKISLVNIMCYILSSIINLYMIDFTKESGSYRGDDACIINMKNEFYMSRIMLNDVKKQYASLQILQEGNYLGGVLDCKGIDCLTKSSVSEHTRRDLRKILLEDILTGEIDQTKLIKDIAILEKKIYTDLKSGSKKYYKPLIVKSIDNYEDPFGQQGVKAAIGWNYVRCNLPGFDLRERNPLDVIKIDINKKNVDLIKDSFPDHYQKLLDIVSGKCEHIAEGRAIKDIWKGGKIDSIGLPKDLPVPEFIIPFIDYTAIINDNLANFPYQSVGLSGFGKEKIAYSNVIKL